MPRSPRSLVRSLALALALSALPATVRADPPRVGLSQAVRLALSSHPTLDASRAQVRRAEALVTEARAALLPTLNVNLTYTRLDEDRRLNDRVIAGADQLSGNVSLSVPLFHARNWASLGRAREGVTVARASADEARRQLAVATARAWLQVLSLRRLAATTERAQENSLAHHEVAAARLASGLGNRLDVLRSSQELASLTATLATQRGALARSQEALGALLGMEGPADTEEEADVAPAPTLPQALTATGSRSDVRASRARLDVAQQAVSDGWTDYVPTLSAVFLPFYQNPPSLSQPLFGWQAQVVLSLPLFDGGLRYGLARERAALRDEARAQLDTSLLQARAEVRAAFASVRAADLAARSAHEAATLADEALSLAEASWRAGVTGNLEVLDAQRRARDAHAQASLADDGAREARLNLLLASGRFP